MPATDPPQRPAALAVHGVYRSFRTGLFYQGRFHALTDVSFEVPAGTTLGLIGPNGSGKSTLLRILAGVDRPTSGSVSVLGDAPESRAVRRRTAFLPDGQPFPGEMSARAALGLVAALKGVARSERRDRVAATLERVGLGDRGKTRLSAFSRGMHRRFGLGQAFIADPSVVFLDEPTAGLDAPGFHVLEDVLTEAKARGTTVVLASHIASDLVEHCDELILLRQGKKLRSGTPEDLLGRDEVESLRSGRRSLLDLYADPDGKAPR